MTPERPTLDPAAYYGLPGEVVAELAPHTEADPVALLGDFLTCFGNAVGAGPHYKVGGAVHPARLYVVIVGATSRSRKGQSRAEIRPVFEGADPGWSNNRVMSGVASGEGLIAAVRDPDDEGHGGTTDKRLLVFEPEFARVLGVAGRDGSTVSPILRDAWDRGELRVMTRKDPLCATGAHISIIGHATVEELRQRLTALEVANGFANRFLYLLVHRSRLLPEGADLASTFPRLFRFVRPALEQARKVGRLRRTSDAAALWDALYRQLADDDRGGLVGAITARAEAQVLRLSMVYALADGSPRIDVPHLEAAHALWDYADRSAQIIFRDSTGDEIADRLLAAIREAGDDGLDYTSQADLFSRHVTARRLNEARQLLIDRGLIVDVKQPTSGRPRVLSFACEQSEKSEERSGR